MVIDGKKIAAEILSNVKKDVAALSQRPVFCDVLVGGDSVSAKYVAMKGRAAERVGMEFLQANFSGDISTDELIFELQKISSHPRLCGLIVQLPLPKQLDTASVLSAINPEIDVDCLGRHNSELFYAGRASLRFPTAVAIMKILDSIGEDFSRGKNLIIGQGRLVGKPVSRLFSERGWNFETATADTREINQLIAGADLIISAAGCPHLLTAEKIKPGCVIIDAGTSEESASGEILGDADFFSVSQKAKIISPVPGGVGPVTVACLLDNVLTAARNKGF